MASGVLGSVAMKAAVLLVVLLWGVGGCSGGSSEGSTTGGGGSSGGGGTSGLGGVPGGGGASSTGGQPGDGGSATGGMNGGGSAHPELRGCTVSTDCVVVPETCCGQCGVAARDDAIALREENRAEYRDLVCEDAPPCLPCAGDPDPTLVATCVAGLCEVVDLLEQEVTACSVNDDCRLRAQACCECGAGTGPGGLIALRSDAVPAYQALVCPPDGGCAGCVPLYPDEAEAVCSAEGRCQVAW